MLVVLAITCASRLLLTKTKLGKPGEDPVAVLEMVAELQLEIQSLVFSGKRESLVKVAEFINVEHEDQSKLEVAKLVVVQRLEEEIAKLKEVEILPYLTDVRKLLLEESSPGIKDGGKTKSVPSDTKPGTVSSEESVHKLLTTSAPRRQFKINGQIGEPDQKDKISFSSLARQIQIGLTQRYVQSEIVDGVIRAITPGLVLRRYLTRNLQGFDIRPIEENSPQSLRCKKHTGVVSDPSFCWAEPERISPSVLDESLRPKAADTIFIE